MAMNIRVTINRGTFDPATEATSEEIFRYAGQCEEAIRALYPEAAVAVRVAERDFDRIDLSDDDDFDPLDVEHDVQVAIGRVFDAGRWVG